MEASTWFKWWLTQTQISNTEKKHLDNVIKKENLEAAEIYFNVYDANYDHKIDKEEFTNVLSSVGATPA